MKLSEKKTMLLAFKENIEMQLFSSDESCLVMQSTEKVEEEEEHSFNQSPQTRKTRKSWEHRRTNRIRQHPLDPDSEELSESDDDVHIRSRSLVESKSEPPGGQQRQSIKSGCLKWKRTEPHRTGLVVKDVICLHGDHGLAQLERYVIPQVEEQVVSGAFGMTARITVDAAWSPEQMESRLVMTFRGKFVKQSEQKVSFVFLQSLQGSKVLFVPETPAEGWTGEQVLRISGHGPLYVFTYLDAQQMDSKKSADVSPEINREGFRPEVRAGSDNSEDKNQR